MHQEEYQYNTSDNRWSRNCEKTYEHTTQIPPQMLKSSDHC